jgi:hypothetical protein
MSLIDRIRELFGGKRSAAEYGTVAGGAAAATSGDDRERGIASSDPSDSGAGDSGSWSGDGGGGGGDGGGGGGSG